MYKRIISLLLIFIMLVTIPVYGRGLGVIGGTTPSATGHFLSGVGTFLTAEQKRATGNQAAGSSNAAVSSNNHGGLNPTGQTNRTSFRFMAGIQTITAMVRHGYLCYQGFPNVSRGRFV